MNPMSKDKPFRELQFSSTQLVVVFLAILVLGVFIFLLGISVGKKQTTLSAASGGKSPEMTETVAQKPPVPADPATQKPQAGATQGQQPAGAASQAPPASSKSEPKPEVKISTPPAGTEAKKPEAAAEAKPAADAKKPAEKPAAPKTEAATKAENSLKKGAYFVQVSAGADKAAAKGFAEKVEKFGYPAFVLDPLKTDTKQVFRVRIGPYETAAQAEDAQTKLAADLKKKKTDFFLIKG